jgi:archaemetzincin
MKSFNVYIIMLSILLMCSCNTSSQDHKKISTTQQAVKPDVRIYIQPFTDLPASYLTYVSTELQKTFKKVIINPRINLPMSSYYPARSRHRADSLLSFLGRQTNDGCHTIGLTTKDISTTKGKNIDWGVMGLGNCPGKACVASSFRLKADTPMKKMEKLYKVAIHELGHTEGLPHCLVETCFMRDAEGQDNTDQETGFCAACKHKLIQAGWKLNEIN